MPRMKAPIVLRISKMPENMNVFDFPCGETNCMTKATMQFNLFTVNYEYQMPLCAKHAKALAEDYEDLDSLN